MSIFIGVDGKANKINSIFIGDNNNKAQQISNLYYGVNNKALQIPLSNPILPKEYQQVKYIESNGTQYINTKVPIKMPIKVIAELEWPIDTSSGNKCFIGAAGGTGYTLDPIVSVYSNSSFKIGMRYISSTGANVSEVNFDTKYKIDSFIKAKEQHFYINDNNIWENSAANDIQKSVNMYMFAQNANNNTINFYAKVKMYSTKIYVNDSLTRNFYPCYRKQDNVIGLYDLVNDVFYINNGTGTFSIGKKCEEELLPND